VSALPPVRFVRSDDWVEVYVGAERVLEGHSVRAEELVNLLGHPVESQWVDRCRWCTEPFPEGSLAAHGGVCNECRWQEVTP
jgi:hypothetical protein